MAIKTFTFPTVSISSSNPANGANGASAPAISTQVGGVGPDGNLHPISTDNSGVQNVNVSTSVLPTGAATAANQVTGNNSLASIDSKLTAPLSVTGPLTDTQLRASAVPVSAASLPLPTGAATAANQATANASLSSIDSKLTAPLSVTGPLTDAQLRATAVPVSGPLTDAQLRATAVPISGTVTANTGLAQPLTDTQLRASAVTVTGPLTDTQLRASAVPVSGPLTDAQLRATAVPISGTVTANTGLTQPLTDAQLRATAVPVSAASLPLPTGAATEVTLASVDTRLADNTASGSITTQNLVPTGAATAGSAVAISVSGKGTVTIQVSGTYTGALSPQVTTDGTVWVTQGNASLQNMATGTNSVNIASGATGIWQAEVNGHAQFRITALAAVTGSATITIRAAQGTSQVTVAGVATAANQTTGNVSLASIDSKTPALGQTVMASSQPVTIASNQSAIPVQSASGRSRVALARNDYSSTSVTTGAYVQLIASTASAANLLEIFDSSGQTLVLAVGGAGSEVDQFYINPGGNGQVSLSIPSGSRVSIKAVTATASAGYINLTLFS